MKSVGGVLGAITRWIMAITACVSFAQFLLLIGVGTKRTQTLAGETLGRALLCGAVAAFWFYRNRKSRLMAAVERQILTAKDEKRQTADQPQARTTSGSEQAPVIKQDWDTDDALAVLYEAIPVTETSKQTTNSSQPLATLTAARVEQPVVVDAGDAAPMIREPMITARDSKTGLIWFVSALALIGAVFIWAMWSDKQEQERRDKELAAAIADSLGSKQTDTTDDASPKDGGRTLSAPGPAKANAATQTSRRANKDPAEFGGRLVSPAADKPKNDAVLGSAYTVSVCPPSLPAGTKP